MEGFLTIFSKVVSMLVMIAVGYAVSKKGSLTGIGAAEITDFLLKIVTPCLIVAAFADSKGSITPQEMIVSTLIMLASMAVSMVVSRLSFRKKPDGRKEVLQFSVMFSNVGFMGIPLVQGIVGGKGVVYASFGIVIFNIISWTYGYRLMNSAAKINLRTILLNPGVIGLVLGLPVYFLNFNMPEFIMEPVDFFAALNTPLAMLIIGTYIAKVDLKSVATDISIYQMSILRLLVAPGILFAILLLLPLQPDMFISSMIQAATPTAASVVLFSVQFGKDSELASKCVAVTTVLSLITLPIWTMLAQIVTS
ncbi:AEC family transporter [Scatolibacter rhodanostii]|uniref:AEC family transporter n=1 Tax=Scatolibacter rhodanostii TaxID=2014781 RepID=UPI000C08D511|nr:AEC family transporter [Scatolibacter rhodanostii]